MSRRIDIELTSARPDGTWTWRAAGAREPKGVLDGSLLSGDAKAGDVLRAEADFEIDGIAIVSVAAAKSRHSEPTAQRIEIIGQPRGDEPGVTTSLVGRSGRGPRHEGDRGPRREGDRGPRREGDRGPRREGDRGPRREGDRGPRGEGDRSGGTLGGRGEGSRREGDRGPRREGDRGPRREGDRGPRRDGAPAARGDGDRGPRREGEAGGRPTGGPRREGGRDERQRRRLTPGHQHRQAVMATLRPEEQAVAEQVLRGGIPAVRTALHLEREKATAEGRQVPDTDGLLSLAEQLLPRLKAAEWRDRAEAVVKAGDDIALRDLRSVVAGADVARDEESRALVGELRQALERRVEAQRTEWVTDIGRHLDEKRVIKALQLSGRPPDPATRLPAELATRVADVAGAAMTAEVAPDRWLALLEAAAASPVRRSVKPAGLPAEPGPDLLRAAHQQSGRVPALAAMLGVSMPPPPGRRPARPPRPAPAGEATPAEAPSSEAPPAEAPPAEAPPAEAPPAEAPSQEAPAADAPPADAPAAEAPASGAAPEAADGAAQADGAPEGDDAPAHHEG